MNCEIMKNTIVIKFNKYRDGMNISKIIIKENLHCLKI